MTRRFHVSTFALLSLLIAASAFAAPRPKTWAPADASSRATAIQPAAAVAEEDEDADLPDQMRGRIDKERYLQLRDEYIATLRGLPFLSAENPRLKAIGQMKSQQGDFGPFGIGPGWTPIGPAPIPNGQTTTIQTAVSGRVTCVAIHPSNANIVYVGTAQGGVYRSLNGGTTWTAIFDQAQSLAIGALALAPSNPTILYVGTGEASGSCDSFFGVGLYRVDNADTAPVLNGPFNPPVTTGVAGTTAFTGRAISRIAVLPSDPATIFVSTYSGIGGIGCDALSGTVPPLAIRGLYRSTDGTSGAPSFQKLTVTSANSVFPDVSGNRSISDIMFEPGNPNNMVAWVLGNAAAGDGGVFRCTNALAANPSFTNTFVTTVSGVRGQFAGNKIGAALTYVVATGETGAGTSCTSGSGALRRSTDGGASWSAKLAGGGGFCGSQCFYDVALDMDPTNASVILIGGAGNGTCSRDYKRSTNAGATFSNNDVGLHADNHVIAFAPSDHNVVYLGNDGGIYKSTDNGVTWVSLNNAGFSATQFQSLALHPNDREFTIGGTQDNGTEYRRPDATWTRADFGDGGFALIDQSAANNTNVTMYHTYFNGTNNFIGFARVNNVACATEGQWAFRGAGIVDGTVGCEGVPLGLNNGIILSDGVLFYAPMALGPGNPNTLYFGTNRLYRSTNRGDVMPAVSQGPLAAGQNVSAIGISPQDDNVRIVGLTLGKVFATTVGLPVLTDVTNAGMPARYVGRAIIDPNNSNTAWVSFAGFGVPAGQHVWKTTNLAGGAAAWVAAGNGIPDVPVNALAVDPANSNTIYAGTDIGVYQSVDGGANWLPVNTGLPVVAVFDMAIQQTNRIIKIATHGRGIWEQALDTPTATLVSLIGSEIRDGRVYLTWRTSGDPAAQVEVYRRYVPGDWSKVGDLSPDGVGNVSFEDADVIPGGHYEYALAIGSGSERTMAGHVWVDVDDTARFALRGVYPNPSDHGVVVTFTLTNHAPASIELVDLSGRRVLSREVGSLGPGQHQLDLRDQRFAPGLYWIRLQQSNHIRTAKVSIVH